MPMEASDIETLLRAAFPDGTILVEPLRGDGDHYTALVISERFRGQSRVRQHQMVYDALEGRMGGELHALQLRTATPENAPDWSKEA